MRINLQKYSPCLHVALLSLWFQNLFFQQCHASTCWVLDNNEYWYTLVNNHTFYEIFWTEKGNSKQTIDYKKYEVFPNSLI